jgi:hypothetical protein
VRLFNHYNNYHGNKINSAQERAGALWVIPQALLLCLGGERMKPWAEWFYNSTAWKKCRKAYAQSVHYQCEDCGGVGEIVHHKTALTRRNIHDQNITLSFSNLRMVCRKCHAMYDANAVTMSGVTFDSEGNLVAIPPT